MPRPIAMPVTDAPTPDADAPQRRPSNAPTTNTSTRQPPPPPQATAFEDLASVIHWAAAHYEPEAVSTTTTSVDARTVRAPDGAQRAKPCKLELFQRDTLTMATITPPQTRLASAPPTHGAHCLVLDVSFSMEAAATVKSLEGDSIDHGFTMLDIAKHAMCTYVASLGAGDFVCVCTYATEAKLVREWTACDDAGKAALFAAIKALKEEGSTNLTAGIATGLRAFEQSLPDAVTANPSDYALLLAIATDGQPSNDTHPPGGPTGYASFVQERASAVARAHGPAAVPALVAIGLGNDLDSRLLSSFSDHFLHIPDPGSVGPFMVNLLAATRSTARIACVDGAAGGSGAGADGMAGAGGGVAGAGANADGDASGVVDISSGDGGAAATGTGENGGGGGGGGGNGVLDHLQKLFGASSPAAATPPSHAVAASPSSAVANRAVLCLSPASCVRAVPGYHSTIQGDEVHVPLGAMTYDQLRHVVIVSKDGAAPLSARVVGGDVTLALCAAPTPVDMTNKEGGGAKAAKAFDAELGRTAAVCALDLQGQRLSVVDGLGAPTDEVAARLAREGGRFGDVTISLVWNDETDLDLHVTIPSGETMSYNNKKAKSGLVELDVDMNAGGTKSKEPVENVFAGDAAKGVEAPRGKYKVRVHNYAYHSSEGLPTPRRIEFKVSVRMHGDVTEYSGVVVAEKEWVDVTEFEYGGALAGAAEQTQQLQEQRKRRDTIKTRLASVPKTLLQEATKLLPDGSALRQTLEAEALLAVQPAKFATWGKHYLVTLPQMLRAQRRSNFRDAALQAFGHDASGNEAFFDELSSEAELCFAQLEPPKPSGLERIARKEAAASAAASRRPTHYTAMPEEFMRGGGCFAPDALVRCVRMRADGGGDGGDDCASVSAAADDDVDVPIAALAPGMRVRTASGAVAAVRCVVLSPCDGGVATLSALPGGLQLTEWHPLLDHRGKWRFPHMLGTRVARRVPAVYNLVLSAEHVAMVGGYPCATLGHGIDGPIVGHKFWGTRAVLDELAKHPGWERGRVVLEAPLRAPAMRAAVARDARA